MIRILLHLKEAFPQVQRITSYARSHTIARISDEDLNQMASAGLNRIHIGMESGSDKVLKMVKKGVDKATQIIAGQKGKRAGVELSEYFLPGIGGKTLSIDNALETADAINQIDPDFSACALLLCRREDPFWDNSLMGILIKWERSIRQESSFCSWRISTG